jgi:hypothetical protein
LVIMLVIPEAEPTGGRAFTRGTRCCPKWPAR